jgi:hypothetical protein
MDSTLTCCIRGIPKVAGPMDGWANQMFGLSGAPLALDPAATESLD